MIITTQVNWTQKGLGLASNMEMQLCVDSKATPANAPKLPRNAWDPPAASKSSWQTRYSVDGQVFPRFVFFRDFNEDQCSFLPSLAVS